MDSTAQNFVQGKIHHHANHFIPITRYAIIDFLRRSEADKPCDQVGEEDFSVYLSAWRHQRFHEKLLRLKEAYMPFSPDRDTFAILEQSEAQRMKMKESLISDIEWLMQRANYLRIDETDLDGIFREKSDYGLDLSVNLDDYEDLIIYFRGCKTEKAIKRSWKTAFLYKKTVDVPVFVRLFLLIKLKPEAKRLAEMMENEGLSERRARRRLKRYRAQLSKHVFSVDEQLIHEIEKAEHIDEKAAGIHLKKYRKLLRMPARRRVKKLMRLDGIDEEQALIRLEKYHRILSCVDLSNYVYVKVFKNIPREDLEMMFPTTRVSFKLFDKIKLSITTGTGIGTSIYGSLGSGTGSAAAGGGLIGGLLAIPYAATMTIAGLAVVVFKQVGEFFNQRTKYSMELARRLYFHSLADNRGALTLMIDRAEEQDLKEDLLLYCALRKTPWPARDLKGLDAHIEDFIEREFGVKADFDIHDAVTRLKEDGLIVENEQGRLVVLEPAEAIEHLKQLLNDRLEFLRAQKHNPDSSGELVF